LLITKTPGGNSTGPPLGVVTLEDIIEEIIGEEIVDETDRFESNTSRSEARRQSTSSIMKGIYEHALRKRTFDTAKPITEENGEIPVVTESPPTETQALLLGLNVSKPDFYGATTPRAPHSERD